MHTLETSKRLIQSWEGEGSLAETKGKKKRGVRGKGIVSWERRLIKEGSCFNRKSEKRGEEAFSGPESTEKRVSRGKAEIFQDSGRPTRLYQKETAVLVRVDTLEEKGKRGNIFVSLVGNELGGNVNRRGI